MARRNSAFLSPIAQSGATSRSRHGKTSLDRSAVECRRNAPKKGGILEGSRRVGSAVAFRFAFSPPVVVACRRDDDRDLGMIEVALCGELQAVAAVETKICNQQIGSDRIELLQSSIK